MVMIYLNWREKAAHETFADYSIDRWGPNWAIARKTPKNLARYGRCITKREYDEGRRNWAEMRALARKSLGLPEDIAA